MNKLTFIEQELVEGINRVQVAHIKGSHVKPPKNAFVMCELPLMSVEEGSENGVNRFEADVEVTKDEDGEITSIKLVSDLITKKDIELDERYIAEVARKRREEYEKTVDPITMEKVRAMLNDTEINSLVDAVKVKYPKAK